MLQLYLNRQIHQCMIRLLMLQTALVLHKKGQLAEAGGLYKEILRSQPGHFDALQLLATIALQQKKFAEAVDVI